MATIRRFEDLLAWQKARLLTKEIYRAFKSCPDRGFIDQIQRASVSVMSNIAEGFESGTRDEFLNYLYIAKGSAGEVRAQLYAAADIGYVNIEIFKNLKALAEDCSRLTASFIHKVKVGSQMGSQRKRESKSDDFDKEFVETLRRENKAWTVRGIIDKDEAHRQGIDIIKE